MPLTAAELNRATLARQLLLRREPIDAAGAVRRVVALLAEPTGKAEVEAFGRGTPLFPVADDGVEVPLHLVESYQSGQLLALRLRPKRPGANRSA